MQVCSQRIIAYEAALAAQPKVVPLARVPEAPMIGESLPDLPPMRRPAALDDIRLEEIAEDTVAAAKAHFARAKILAGQVAANAHVQAIKLGNALKLQAHVRSPWRAPPVVLPLASCPCCVASVSSGRHEG
jgi:hypothetical protein